MESIMKYVLAISCIGSWILSYSMYGDAQDFLSEALLVEGEVSAVIEIKPATRNDSWTYRPQVLFETLDNEVVEFVSDTGSNPSRYEVGDKVEVYYHPSAPEEAKINSFLSLWGGSVFLVVFGIISIIFAVLLHRGISIRFEWKRKIES